MRARPAGAGAALVWATAMLGTFGARPASAHRLDEYLQATTVSVWRDRIVAQIRLTPGVAVFPAVFAGIDADGNGALSAAEQRAYAERVLRDLSLTVDGDRLPLRLVAVTFPGVVEMREGRGEIVVDFDAAVPRGGGDRRLTFANHHQPRIGVYLVNCLVPRDPGIRITAQHRNYEQSFYRLDYAQAGPAAGPLSLAWWSGPRGWLGTAALLPLAWLAARRPRPAGAANETAAPA